MTNIRTKLYDCVRTLFARIAPLFAQRFVERFKEQKLQQHYYSDSIGEHGNEVICMIDGKVKHGGLTDRINGIITCFDAALKSERKFKILFNHPFELNHFLLPNQYNWEINSEDVKYDCNTKPLFIRSFDHSTEAEREKQLMADILRYNTLQLHVYTNICSVNQERYNTLFHTLFKPSEYLNAILERERKLIGYSYVSATFRFQQLLNDFEEGNYKILSHEDRSKLLSKCTIVINQLNKKHPDKKILITSDSSTFLDSAKRFPYVHVISGKTIHMEYNDSSDKNVHAKAFVDLFMISEADTVYSVVLKPMYESGFPKFAAKIYNRPFKLIREVR